MFSFLKPPLERRMFALIWPRTEDIRGAHPVLIQATIAIPNLAIAATLLLRSLPREKAEATAVKIEALMFRLIAADQAFYSVGEVLQLPAERNAWRMYTLSVEPSIQSNLDTIIRVVYSMRLDKYQEECRKGFLMATENAGQLGEYGPLGFVAKRFLSDNRGIPILRDDDLSEEGFADLGATSLYFANVCNTLAEEIKK